jgi:hypothetical protein
MTAPDLLPCPFCGGMAAYIVPAAGGKPYVMCVRNQCTQPSDDCVSAWNRRTPEVQELIRAAVGRERERCARIAEAEGVYPELNVYAGGPEWYRHGKRIAAAIRGPK